MNVMILETPYEMALGVAERFRALRKAKKITLKEVAEKSGVPYSTIRRFESKGEISFPAFVLKLRAVFSILQSRDKRNIYLPTEGGFRIVSSADILFFEVQGHYVTVHCKDRPDLVYKDSLRSLEEKLAGLPFQRCNHCYLVNLSHVAGIDHGDVLVGSARLPVSRPKKKAFLEALTKYMGGI